jgi:hypothetical protein
MGVADNNNHLQKLLIFITNLCLILQSGYSLAHNAFYINSDFTV